LFVCLFVCLIVCLMVCFFQVLIFTLCLDRHVVFFGSRVIKDIIT
jgi:hypothetical protein